MLSKSRSCLLDVLWVEQAKNSLNRENSLCGHHFSTQNIL